VPAVALPADLSRPQAAAALATALRRRRLTVDVLVNNAGVLEAGLFARMPARSHRQMIDLNVSALSAVLAQFVRACRRRAAGDSQRSPRSPPSSRCRPCHYAATKAFVLSLSESLAEELRDSGVTVTALCRASPPRRC